MQKRLLRDEYSRETKRRRRQLPNIRFIKTPDVHTLSDLIELGRSIRFYKNLDSVMLWRIVDYLQELNDMVGMESLKQSIFYQVIYYLKGLHTKNRNEEYLHSVITGHAGCGKSTVAQIIGKIYQAMGILSKNGVFKTAYKDDFVASYVGQTVPQTRKLLKSCLGGVLFIDEAYSLGYNKNDHGSFSKEAIDTLNRFLSEHKSDFCCIIAGYREEIEECFFAVNKGLQSRFAWVHHIDPYTSEELAEIFLRKVKMIEWETVCEKKYLATVIERNKSLFTNSGRDVVQFLGKCKMCHARRVFTLSDDHKFVLTTEDIDGGMEMMRSNSHQNNDDPPPGMYT